MTTRLSPDWWREVLVRVGVKLTTAEMWCDAFAEHIRPEHFSLGEREFADLLGQCLHETAMLEHLEEDLMYSARRITEVWPQRFPTEAQARIVANNPKALANRTYGHRLGNTEENDGWTFRGRGCPMITGRANYKLVQEATGLPLLSEPDLLTHPGPCLKALVAWWEKRVPDAAIGDPLRVTKAVQGGGEALQRRTLLTNKARAALMD